MRIRNRPEFSLMHAAQKKRAVIRQMVLDKRSWAAHHPARLLKYRIDPWFDGIGSPIPA